MSDAPFFSIIIPTKDRTHLLKECLDSIIKQSFVDFELIIVDDPSASDTEILCKSYTDPRIKYHKYQHNDRSLSRNTGIHVAQGKYICFIDDDDMILEDYLGGFYDFLSENLFPKIILRTGFIKYHSEKHSSKSPLYNKAAHKNPVNFATYNMCGVWSLCIPRMFLVEDVFPLNFPHWQDTHLILRLLAKHPFRQLPTHQYLYRIHGGRGSSKVTTEGQLAQRAQKNVEAIEHFFSNHGGLVTGLLPVSTLSFLKAEKYIQYSLISRKSRFKELSKKLFKMSTSEKLDYRLWKYYILYNLYRLKRL